MIISIIATIFSCYSSGQASNATQTQALEKLDPNAPLVERILVQHRRLLGVAIPFVFYQVLWWSCAIKYNFFSLFADRYFISITMIFGSMIAGKENTFSGSPPCTFKTEPSKTFYGGRISLFDRALHCRTGGRGSDFRGGKISRS